MAQSTRRFAKIRRLRFALACAFAAGLPGCSSSATGLAAPATAGDAARRLGSFQVASIGAPPGTIAPTACAAGDHERYLGAELVDADTNLIVRLVIDPLWGPALRVYDGDAPFDRSVLFFREECTTFEMALDETGSTVNGIVERSLALAVECENEDGAVIRGSASAASCD
jgi:hypothetical protein